MLARRRRSTVVLNVAFAILTPSCGGSQPAAPFGLESISLPEGSDEIAAVLSEMPDRLRGLAANELSEGDVEVGFSYGPKRDLSVGVIDFGSGEGDFPTQTAGELLPGLAESGEIDVADSDLQGELLWFTGENHELNEEGEVVQTFWQMWFGVPSSGWVFAVSAPSEGDGVALVEAFVEAAS